MRIGKDPSKEMEEYWVYAISPFDYPESTENVGKWMLFINIEFIDEVWNKIANAIEEGKLGKHAKCATMKPNPNASNPNSKVICIYTYDSEDKKDVARIAWNLFKLGVVSFPLNYKKDKVTLEGKYANRGNKRISRYSIKKLMFENKTEEEFIQSFCSEFAGDTTNNNRTLGEFIQ